MSAIIEDGSEDPRAFKRFSIYSEAWYSKTNPRTPGVADEIGVGIDSEDGGTHGGFTIVLHENIGFRIESFDDSWWILLRYPGLFVRLAGLAVSRGPRKMGHQPKILTGQVIDALKAEGFVDRTARRPPRGISFCDSCGAPRKKP